MPIYEYKCRKCNEEFEKLVFGNSEIKCPKCESRDIIKKFSVFGMSGVEKPFSGMSNCNTCNSNSCNNCR